MLNTVYSIYDCICKEEGCFKVETIGDGFMVRALPFVLLLARRPGPPPVARCGTPILLCYVNRSQPLTTRLLAPAGRGRRAQCLRARNVRRRSSAARRARHCRAALVNAS